jgi:pimeloyl-ACP methyl ester carboxylesterase
MQPCRGPRGSAARLRCPRNRFRFRLAVRTFAAWPQRVRNYAIETTRANLLDWKSAYAFRLTPQSLATVAVPTLVVWGEASHPAVRRVNDLLSRYIPQADRVTIAGAAHFMIATHPKPFADLVARHVGQSSLGESSLGDSSLGKSSLALAAAR